MGSPNIVPPDGQLCHIAGWGKTGWPLKAFKRVLLDVSVPIQDWETCKTKWQYRLNEGHICAGTYYKDSCVVSWKFGQNPNL